MKNYQKIIVLLLCVVSLCFSVILTASADESVDNLTFTAEASAPAVNAGEDFTVTIKTTKNDGFYYANADLFYDSNLVEFVGIDTTDSVFSIGNNVVVSANNKVSEDKSSLYITIGTTANMQAALDPVSIKQATLMSENGIVLVAQFKAIEDLNADAIAKFKLFVTSAFVQGKPSADAPDRANYDYIVNGAKDGSKGPEINVNIVSKNHDCRAYADNKIVVTEGTPTCEDDGELVWKCPHCFGENKDIFPSFGGHDLKEDVAAKAPTCTEAGWDAYKKCSRCDYTTKVEKPAAHKEVIDAAVEADCTQDGKTEGKHCSVCGTVIVAQKKIAATGHVEEIVPGVPATWNKAGLTEGKICSVCDEVLVEQAVIDATGMPAWAIVLIVIGSLVVVAGAALLVLWKMGKLGKKA